MSLEQLEQLISRIAPLDHSAIEAARQRQARLTKPPGSLGRLEALSLQLAGILGSERPSIRGAAIIVAAGDHGVVAEGVTDYPQAVTAQMVQNFLAGGAAINAMARQAGVELVIVDAGVASTLSPHPQLRRLGIAAGTGNIAAGPAMTREQAEQSVLAGIELAQEAAAAGADIIGTGDMGIGNTTSAAAITSAVTGAPAEQTTGRGTGRSDAQLASKIDVVERALRANQPDRRDGLDILSKLGGFEIGVLAGVILGGALSRRVVVLDGFISTAAGLIAECLHPGVVDFCVAAHLSAERGHRAALAHLGLEPLLDLDMRLGEGTGAALAVGLIESAAACLREMATFDEAGVSDAEREPSSGPD